MATPNPSNTRIRVSISLRPDQYRAMQRVALEDLHGNASRVVQDLLDEEFRRRYGRDWQAVLEPEPAPESAVAA